MTKRILRFAFLGLLGLSLTACTGLPRGAAMQSEILNPEKAANGDFEVYEITRANMASFAKWPAPNRKHYHWPPGSSSSGANIVRPGDTLDVVIWDSDTASLFTSPGQQSTVLQALKVSSNGTVNIPFVGTVQVAGKSPEGARRSIERSLDRVSPAAQLQMQHKPGSKSTVNVVSGVGRPGTVALEDGANKILSVLAKSGGVSAGLQNPQIRLQRSTKVYGISVDALSDKPSANIALQGGDSIIIERDERYFLSLGAAGSESSFNFTRDEVSALDALSIIGGVKDSSADPGGVLILRNYEAGTLNGSQGPNKSRVVFTIDLTSADGLFSAGEFKIHHGDLVYPTESPVTDTRTIFSLIGSAFAVANNL